MGSGRGSGKDGGGGKGVQSLPLDVLHKIAQEFLIPYTKNTLQSWETWKRASCLYRYDDDVVEAGLEHRFICCVTAFDYFDKVSSKLRPAVEDYVLQNYHPTSRRGSRSLVYSGRNVRLRLKLCRFRKWPVPSKDVRYQIASRRAERTVRLSRKYFVSRTATGGGVVARPDWPVDLSLALRLLRAGRCLRGYRFEDGLLEDREAVQRLAAAEPEVLGVTTNVSAEFLVERASRRRASAVFANLLEECYTDELAVAAINAGWGRKVPLKFWSNAAANASMPSVWIPFAVLDAIADDELYAMYALAIAKIARRAVMMFAESKRSMGLVGVVAAFCTAPDFVLSRHGHLLKRSPIFENPSKLVEFLRMCYQRRKGTDELYRFIWRFLGKETRRSADVQEGLVVCNPTLLNSILYDIEAWVGQGGTGATGATRALADKLAANEDFTNDPVSVNLVSNLYFRSRLAHSSPFLVPLNRSEAYTQLVRFPHKTAECSALLTPKDVIGAVHENDSILYHVDQAFLIEHREALLSCPISRLCRWYLLKILGVA